MAKPVVRQREADTTSSHSSGKGRTKNADRVAGSKAVIKSSRYSCTCCFWSLLNILKWPAILLVIPPLVNYASLKKEQEMLLPDDALLYDVGHGQRLMLRCLGKGAPTIILEHPAGVSSDIWTDVRRQLSKISKVCVYDRAGIGFSERPVPTDSSINGAGDAEGKKGSRSQEFTVETMADDLKRLVTQSSSQPQPFILVGLELGALTSRFYSHMYDNEVAHVVLIDPLTQSLFNNKVWTEYWRTDVLYRMQARQMAGAMGINRLALITGFSDLPDLWTHFKDGNVTARQKFLSCHPKHLKSAVDELAGVLDSMQQIKTFSTVKPFPKSLQYTVLYREKYDLNLSEELNDIWKDARESLSASLHIPADQMSITGTTSHNLLQSLSGQTLSKLLDVVRSKVNEYRKGQVRSTAR